MKKLFAIILSALIIITMCTITVFAVERDISLDKVDDGRLKITEEGTYVLTGKLSGSVYVDPGKGDVKLILDGVDIDGANEPGIIAVSGDSLTIELPKDSVNRIKGTAGNLYKATIYSSIDTFFEGDGALYVIGESASGIKTENADLTFNGGSYAITAQDNAITAEGQQPGALTVNEGHFSTQAENAVDPDANFEMNGGAFDQPLPEGMMNNSQNQNAMPQNEENTGFFGRIMQMFSGNQQLQIQDGSQQPQINGEMNRNGQAPQMQNGQQPPEIPNGTRQQNGNMPQNGMQSNVEVSDSASEVVQGTMTNSAASLEADYDNATYITVSDDENDIKITSSGTYIITGTCSDGNITVKKGTTGVVLVLEDLDLTSTTGATVSVNKEA